MEKSCYRKSAITRVATAVPTKYIQTQGAAISVRGFKQQLRTKPQRLISANLSSALTPRTLSDFHALEAPYS
eukprot:1181921-Prorocentrum_minimum.AAC.4